MYISLNVIFTGPRCTQKPNTPYLNKRRPRKRIKTKPKSSPPNKKFNASLNLDSESKENFDGKDDVMFCVKQEIDSDVLSQGDGSSYSIGKFR